MNIIVNIYNYIGILHSTWTWVYTIITTILHGIDVCVSFELNVNSHLVRYTDYQYNNSSLTVNSPCSIYSTWSWLPIFRSPNSSSFCGRWWKWGSYMLFNLLMVRSWLPSSSQAHSMYVHWWRVGSYSLAFTFFPTIIAHQHINRHYYSKTTLAAIYGPWFGTVINYKAGNKEQVNLLYKGYTCITLLEVGGNDGSGVRTAFELKVLKRGLRIINSLFVLEKLKRLGFFLLLTPNQW